LDGKLHVYCGPSTAGDETDAALKLAQDLAMEDLKGKARIVLIDNDASMSEREEFWLAIESGSIEDHTKKRRSTIIARYAVIFLF